MPQEIHDLLKRVRRLEIVSNRFANDLFAGQYQSVFRGRGMEFSEVREYQPGDDIRQIDWNVTARTGHPFVKRFVEERELTLLFLVDASASGLFGSSRSKIETALETVATLMFSALKNNDKVGLLTFADEVIGYTQPRKGRTHVLNQLRQLVALRPRGGRTEFITALDYADRVTKRRSVIFLVSDLFAEEAQRPELEKKLARLRRRHDLIVLTLTDPREVEFPNIGLLRLRDPETGQTATVDTASRQVREELARRMRVNKEATERLLRRAKTDTLAIGTDRDFLGDLRGFFKNRQRLRHRENPS